MTKKQSQKALKLYTDLDIMIHYHNKNLTKAQYWLLDEICDYLHELSEKAMTIKLK